MLTEWSINAVPFITRHLYAILILNIIYMGVYTIVHLEYGPVYSIITFEKPGWIVYPVLLFGAITAVFFSAKFLSKKKNTRYNFIQQRHLSCDVSEQELEYLHK